MRMINASIGFLFVFTLTFVASSSSPVIKLKKLSDGFNLPVAIVDAKDGTKYLYIVERSGIIKRVHRVTGNIQTESFLDVASLLGPCSGYCDERGLLGLAFHPNYDTNGYFYINYTSEDSNGVLRTIISRFSRNDVNPKVADDTSEFVLISFEQPWSNHNAGDLQFGPDGYLYITSGDGGYFGDPDNNGQDITSMLGKILRIDVDQTSSGKNYTVPTSNPFISTTGAVPEIWAYGLRNPWRISFDLLTGDLFIADVGQNLWEELNYQPANSSGGENYGWKLMEGNHCYDPSVNCLENTSASLTMPILEYEHVSGACSITGGYVYRGKQKARQGSYYYGDYCNGTIWAATIDELGTWTSTIVSQSSGLFISTFGEDFRGNVYVADIVGGAIYKINKCYDSKSYYINGKKRKTCKWIRKRREERVKRLCRKTAVYNNCKATCHNPTC